MVVVRVVLTLAMFLLGVASQADPSEPPVVDDDTPQIMAGLAKGESRYAIAEMVWKKRVADVTIDPAKAESEAYQEKLDAAETELAEAQLQLENAQRKDKVAKDTRNEMREAQAEIRKDSKRKVAELKAENTVLDERNDALLVRVQGLTREQHEMRQTRKEGTLNTELNIRGAVGGMAQAMQRDAQLKDELKEAEDRITGLAEKDAAAKAGVEAAGKIQAALAAAGERFTELGKEKTAKMKALKPPSFDGDSQSGRWYDVQKQGVRGQHLLLCSCLMVWGVQACLDFCRPVEGVWTCTLAGDVEVNSTDYSEVDFPIPCESKGAKSDTDAGRDLIALDKKLDQAMEQVTKLSAMAQATDYHQLQADQVEAAGYVGAAKVQLSLLEHTEENVAQRLAKERAQLEERVSDEDRIAALEQQVKDLEAKKKKKAKQIKALQRAVQLVNNPDASLRQKVDVNHQLQDVGLPYDKLDLED